MATLYGRADRSKLDKLYLLLWFVGFETFGSTESDQRLFRVDTFVEKRSTEPEGNVVRISKEEQDANVTRERQECFSKMSSDPHPKAGGLYCNRTWDGLMCWPDTPANVNASQPCPGYIHLFRRNGVAIRRCLANGDWYVSSRTNLTWTDYRQCIFDEGHEFQILNATSLGDHVPRIKTIYRVGYGLTIITLTAAVYVMVSCRKLHCPRNTIHVNLFLSFMLRAVVAFLRESLFVDGLGLSKDLIRLNDNSLAFRADITHWECRTLMVAFNYAITTNNMWIFVEGLYLNVLIFRDVFSESSSVSGYIIFGWLSSMIVVIPWALVRALLDNYLCWNTHPNPRYFWIIKLPAMITVLINFFFFVNVLLVLFTKLKSTNSSESRRYRQRKLARSTLVLIPLFGVPYIVFLGLPDNINESAEIVKLYFEMIFNSFNGILVAILFCFMNGEVQSELKKKWQKCRLFRRYIDKSSSSSRRQSNTTVTHFLTQTNSTKRNSQHSVHSVMDKFDSRTKKRHSVFPDIDDANEQVECDEAVKINNCEGVDYGQAPPSISKTPDIIECTSLKAVKVDVE